MTDLPDLAVPIMQAAEKRIKIFPHKSNRASEAGHECERFLCLSRTNWQDKKPHEVTLQRIFDLGNVIEAAALADCAASGVKIIEQQRSFSDERLNLTGHVDGEVEVVKDGVAHYYPVEIKGLAHHTWQSLNQFSDFLTAKTPWTRRYPAQLTLYMYMDNKEWGCFLLFSKQTWEVKCIWIPLDLDYAEALLQKLERVNAHIAAGTLPEQIDDVEMCTKCDHFLTCLPSIRRTAVEISDDPELESEIDRWFALKKPVAEYNKLDKVLKSKCDRLEKSLIGDYMVTGKQVTRKGFTTEDSTYWKRSIVRLVPAEEETE